MKRLNILKCASCRSFLEYEPEDIAIIVHGNRFRVYCPLCKSENKISAAIFHELFPDGKREKEFVKKEVKPPKPDLSKKQFNDAVKAAEALGDHGSQAKAAKSLGISIPTLVKRLKSLPAPEEAAAD